MNDLDIKEKFNGGLVNCIEKISKKQEIKSTSDMNVYQKVALARKLLKQEGLKPTGHNKFAGYDYFTLDDIVPSIINITCELGLLTITNFIDKIAILTIFDCDHPDQTIEFQSPVAECTMKGLHPIQNLGSMQTYMRRYLLMLAFEIVENDVLDNITVKEQSPYTQPNIIRHQTDNQQQSPKFSVPEGSSWLDKIITEKQLKRLYAIAINAGCNAEHVERASISQFKKYPSELNQKDYEILVSSYQNFNSSDDEAEDLPFN